MDLLSFNKLIYHGDKIEKISKNKPQFPVNLTVSLGNYCNHACLWCTVYAVQENKVRHADLERYLSFFRRGQEHGLKAVSYVGNGEPTAYPRFGELISEVNRLGIQQGMFTNGYLLDRYMDQVIDYFTFARISLDAGSPEVHDAMHQVNGQFDKIIRNLEEIVKRRRDGKPTIGVQYATHQENFHDLYKSAQIASEIGADYFSIKPVFNWGGGADKDRIDKNRLTNDDLEPEALRIRQDLERKDFTIYYRPFQIDSIVADRNVFGYDRCVAGFFNFNMYEDGSLTCCSPHKVKVGTIDDDIETLIGQSAEEMERMDLSKCPPSCRYHPMNHLVDTLLNPDRDDPYHKNFI